MLSFTLTCDNAKNTVDAHITFHELPQRRKLELKPRAQAAPASSWDSGDGSKQWSNLNVSVDRKKTRCAECTRPLPEGCTTMLCHRCSCSPQAPALRRPSNVRAGFVEASHELPTAVHDGSASTSTEAAATASDTGAWDTLATAPQARSPSVLLASIGIAAAAAAWFGMRLLRSR